MCGALAWLSSTSTLPDDHCRKKKEPKKKENSDFPSWLSMETDEDAELSGHLSFESQSAERREQQRFQLKQMEESLKRYQANRARDEGFRFIKRVKRSVAA